MNMLERAVCILSVGRMGGVSIWSLAQLRKATGIAMRSQYRLSEQLKNDPRVEHRGGNTFSIKVETGS